MHKSNIQRKDFFKTFQTCKHYNLHNSRYKGPLSMILVPLECCRRIQSLEGREGKRLVGIKPNLLTIPQSNTRSVNEPHGALIVYLKISRTEMGPRAFTSCTPRPVPRTDSIMWRPAQGAHTYTIAELPSRCKFNYTLNISREYQI